MLFDRVDFYKMADYCRPEVVGDVISDQRARWVEVAPLIKFDDPSSNRLPGIPSVTDNRQTDRQTTDRAMTIVHSIHYSLQLFASVG